MSCSVLVVETAGAAESVTLIVTVEVPALVGTPLSTPFEASERPAGSVPEDTAKWYGATPPRAVSVYEYRAPVVGRSNVASA
jgi:hypothetical protein